MRRKIVILFLFVIMTLIMSPVNEAEAASSVSVSLPAFKVSLNGVGIENSYRQYPLIVYNDITYFPMTYYDSRFMGLESLWNNNAGLAIVKTGVNWDYNKYETSQKNKSIYSAQIAPFRITVNGKTIDNYKEKYPLLLFRNVTYFPLTWRFAVDEFGWKYTFDQNKGLIINSTDSAPSAGQLTLPIVTRENGEKGAFTMAGDYFYYEGANGVIYQTPINNPAQKKAVYNLPMWSYGDSYVMANLRTVDDKAMLSYHQGGAVMGTDYEIIINEDGSNEIFDMGYSHKKDFGNVSVRVDQWAPPFANNLTIKLSGEQEYRSIGNSDYLYGWVKKGSGRSPSDDLVLIGENIYILATEKPEDYNTATGIYRVNINSNETVRLCDNEATSFKIVDEIIYFADQNQFIYKVPLTGGQAELLVDEAVDLYEIFHSKVYYSLKSKNNQLYIYGNEVSENRGGILKSLEIQNGYMVAVFDKSSESQYKMMIFNDNGRIIYKTIENVLLVRIDNGKIVFVKDN